MEHNFSLTGSILEWIFGGGLLAIVVFSANTYIKSNKSIGRVYERIDEEKGKNEKRFVLTSICEILHKTLKDEIASQKQDIKDIKNDIKELLTLVKSGGK